MSIEEYRNILKDELSKGDKESTNLNVLRAKRELLNDVKDTNLINMLKVDSISEQISILNNYLNQNNSGNSQEKGIRHTLSNPSIPKFMISNEDEGFSNVVILSIALILLCIIILMIIFV